ncbi:MAG: hypothetical protein ABIH69_03430, partial [bacterium]
MAKLSLSLFLVFCFLFFTTLVVSCGDVEMALSSLTVTPSAATVGISQPQAFSVIARDSGGYLQNITPVWSLTGGIGSISAAGLFEASGTAGSGYVVATYGGISKQAAVT